MAMEATTQAMKSLKQRLGEIEALGGMGNLLFWDKEVMLAAGGHGARKKQMETLALVAHERRTSKELGDCMDALHKHPDLRAVLSPMEAATVREARRDYTRATRMPTELEVRLAGLRSSGYDAWSKARETSDFQIMAPALEEWLEALKEEAAAVAPEMRPYDYCLDKFERGATVEKIDAMFSSIKQPLIDLLRKVVAENKSVAIPGWSELKFPLDSQKKLGEKVVREMGFKLENGRLDNFGGHPSTTSVSSPTDVRLTTRYLEDNLMFGIGATIHEAGHGLYEQGRDLEASENGLIASGPPSLGLHESQSLLWERSVGLSREFWSHYWSRGVVEAFPELESSLGRISHEDFYRQINVVKPGFQIRVDTDELSYPLHVLLRYEIEKGLFDGSLSVQEIPGVWKAKMEEYVGAAPKDDAEGCLQDVHWGMGAFGYFPTYVIGAIYAYQIFDAADRDMGGELRQQVGEGRLLPLREWLRDKIHSVGSVYETAEELVELVTGKPMDTGLYLGHLTTKYADIYLNDG
ncbi:uncharacterized protein LOC9640653 [Selaginella moellendorffii]|nr:uncharacterized protein LOC9640653 [Selaginella moellendorffii]|eukprot:XP_002972010.2 uncharacterized protein LOC9640653 [Selaginella moellendorffii]